MNLLIMSEDGITTKSPNQLQDFYESGEVFHLNPTHVYVRREGVVEQVVFEIANQSEDVDYWYFTVNVVASDGVLFLFYFELAKELIAALEQWYMGLAEQIKP